MTDTMTEIPTNGLTEAPGTQQEAPGEAQPIKKASRYTPKKGVSPEVREAKQKANAKSLENRAANKAEREKNELLTGKTTLERRRLETAELDQRINKLQEHAADLGWDFGGRQEFFHWGQRILVAAIWNKKSNEHLDVSRPFEEEVPFEEQEYCGFHVPEACAQMAGLSHQVHLTQPLIDFMVEVFTVAKKRYFLVPGATKGEIAYVLRELEQREAGIDTYDPWTELPKQKVDGIDTSTWPKDFQKLILSGQKLSFDDLRLYLTLALEQDIPEHLRKEYEAILGPVPKKPAIVVSAPDPLIAAQQKMEADLEERQQRLEMERLRQLSPAAWEALQRGRF